LDATERLRALFAPDGPLKAYFPRFQLREDQLNLALNIMAQLRSGSGQLVVEAGTGTGKSLAYLAAAYCAEKRVLISTGTLALQDQLFQKDLPDFFAALSAAGEQPPNVVLMKGRSNYLCQHRLATHAPGLPLMEEGGVDEMAQLISWSEVTDTGDKAEAPFMSENSFLWRELDARSETCLGRKCPDYKGCFVTRLRDRAQEADWVIVNHALLCADRMLRMQSQKPGHDSWEEQSFGQILPDVDAWIIDEAHLLEEIASRQFGFQISSQGFGRLHRECEKHKALLGATTQTSLAGFFESMQLSFWTMLHPWSPDSHQPEGQLLADVYEDFQRRDFHHDFQTAFKGVMDAIKEMQNNVAADDELLTVEIGNLEKRAARIWSEMDFTLSDKGLELGFVSYGQPEDDHINLICAPVDVSQVLQNAFWNSPRAFVLTSASISVANKLAPFCRRVGLFHPETPSTELQTELYQSPFDFQGRCGLYCPEGMPAPDHPDFIYRYDDEVMDLIDLSSGGAFLLFTSYRAMSAAKDRLSHRFLLRGIRVLVQGEKPKMTLLSLFKQESEQGPVVLMATHSFWMGVDVQGKALRLVVMDRLPFKPPVEPLQRAKSQWLRRQNRSPFNELALPQAAQILKQGAGRLMRHAEDAGIVAIMDGRLSSKGYGKTLKRSLPPFKALRSMQECQSFWYEVVSPALDLPLPQDQLI